MCPPESTTTMSFREEDSDSESVMTTSESLFTCLTVRRDSKRERERLNGEGCIGNETFDNWQLPPLLLLSSAISPLGNPTHSANTTSLIGIATISSERWRCCLQWHRPFLYKELLLLLLLLTSPPPKDKQLLIHSAKKIPICLKESTNPRPCPMRRHQQQHQCLLRLSARPAGKKRIWSAVKICPVPEFSSRSTLHTQQNLFVSKRIPKSFAV